MQNAETVKHGKTILFGDLSEITQFQDRNICATYNLGGWLTINN